jgi:hypothetical protein
MKWAGHVACMGEVRKMYKVLVGKPEGKRPLRGPKHRCENGIRMDQREKWLAGAVEWIQLAQDKGQWQDLVNVVMNLRVLAPQCWLVS